MNDPHPSRCGARLGGMFAALLALAAAGCAGRGILYTRVVEPYTTDFHETRTGNKVCRVNEHTLREPFSGADVSVNFTWRVVEEAARTAGMTNLYYVDIETFSILDGTYERKTLICHGE